MAETIERRACIGPINLEELEKLPAGSLGREFADHCRSRGIDPNLVHIAPEDEESWLLNHLFETHDIWHVVTGWPNDGRGEVGLAGFYCGQLHSPAFFAFMLSLVILKTVWRKESTSQLFDAFVSGYRDGQRTLPLFGTAWNEFWQEPLVAVRARFDYSPSEDGYGLSSQAA